MFKEISVKKKRERREKTKAKNDLITNCGGTTQDYRSN